MIKQLSQTNACKNIDANEFTNPCFYSILSIGMKPQSGTYKISFKINQIDNRTRNTAIGIISQNCQRNNHNDLKWFNHFYDYTRWNTTGFTDCFMPNGL